MGKAKNPLKCQRKPFFLYTMIRFNFLKWAVLEPFKKLGTDYPRNPWGTHLSVYFGKICDQTSFMVIFFIIFFSPVMMMSAAKQENDVMSRLMRWRLWEKSMIESIQSPKARTHCERCSTTPLQNISLCSLGFDLQEHNEKRTSYTVQISAHKPKKKRFRVSLWRSLPVR